MKTGDATPFCQLEAPHQTVIVKRDTQSLSTAGPFVFIRVHSWFPPAWIRLRQFVHAIEPAGLGRPAGIHQLNVPPASGKGAVNSRPTAGPDGVAALQLIVSAHNGRNLDEHIGPADSNRCDANFVI